jgi:predicted alpha/beta-hydrolase family hydrolase
MRTVAKKTKIDLGRKGSVSAVLSGLEPPCEPSSLGLVIAHGAANDMDNALIVAVAEGLATAGIANLRFNFPYKEKGKTSPDAQATLVHTWKRAFDAMLKNPFFPVTRIIAAGKSMGGRVASQMVAEGVMSAAGLIFLGYPLHAPGRKYKLRDAHLYQIRVPMLFIAGTQDPLCDLARLNTVLGNLRCPHELATIAGGNHSFRLPRSAKQSQAKISHQIITTCLAWLRQIG